DAPETRAGERAAKQGVSLGVDSAAIVKMGYRAHDAAMRLAPRGAPVNLELDVQSHDRYGRLLAYLWLSTGRMMNEELVQTGYAMVLTVPPNVRYAARFVAAQEDARRNRRGLWGNTSLRMAALIPAAASQPAATTTPRAGFRYDGNAPCWARNPAWTLPAFYLELIRHLATELPVPTPLVLTVQALDETNALPDYKSSGGLGAVGVYRHSSMVGADGKVVSQKGTIGVAMRHSEHYDPVRQCWFPETIRHITAHEIGHAVRFQLYPTDRWRPFVARTGLLERDAEEIFANAYARAFVQGWPPRPARPPEVPIWAVEIVRDFVAQFPRRTLL
ncbi:MAG: thermonuclease family protein, partial [Longimicrobiales bacterium]|nr:thermonuclease family protein [Longimicrobiales bacterium]